MKTLSKTNKIIDHRPFEIFQQYDERGEISYSAGLPNYPRNFSRDTIIAGLISCNVDLLSTQLEISAQYQGQKEDSKTGEKPGKIHHEYPGVKVNNRELISTYNASDTTGLFLIAAEILKNLDQHRYAQFIANRKNNLQKAADYITSSIDNNFLLWEIPPKNSNQYALKVTYWKDSILPEANGKTEPIYPVIYPQVQFIAARGLLSASILLNDNSLANIAKTMFIMGIKKFIRENGYVAYQDKHKALIQTSSDELHSLAYIPQQYKEFLPLQAISARAEQLSTPFGYMCTPLDISNKLSDNYHGKSVWIFEQAMIHYGANKFSLVKEKEIASLVANHIQEGQELLTVGYNNAGEITPIPSGNNRQLWSIAAREYFAGQNKLLADNWL